MCQASSSVQKRPTIYSAICHRPSYSNRETGQDQEGDHAVRCFDSSAELMDFLTPLIRENVFGANLSDWDFTILVDGVDWAMYQSMDTATKAFYTEHFDDVVDKMGSVESGFLAEKAENDSRELARLERAGRRAALRQATKDKALLKSLLAKYGALP